MEQTMVNIGGINSFLIQDVESSYNTDVSAIKEFIDNSISAGAKNIKLTITKSEIVIEDDGKGFSEERLIDFASNLRVSSNLEFDKHNSKDTLNMYGMGAHAGLLKLSNCDGESHITIKSNGKQYDAIIHKKKEWIFANGRVIDCDYGNGTKVRIENPRPINVDYVLKEIKESCALYPYKKKAHVFFNGEEIQFHDRCYIKELGDLIHTKGYKAHPTHEWLHAFVSDEIKINEGTTRVVVVYVNTDDSGFEIFKTNKVDSEQSNHSGLYVYCSGNYITHGMKDKLIYHLGKFPDNNGGAGRIRVFIDGTHIPTELGLASNKNREIPPLLSNPELSELRSTIETLYTQALNFHKKREKGIADEVKGTFDVMEDRIIPDAILTKHEDKFSDIKRIEYVVRPSTKSQKIVYDYSLNEEGVVKCAINENVIEELQKIGGLFKIFTPEVIIKLIPLFKVAETKATKGKNFLNDWYNCINILGNKVCNTKKIDFKEVDYETW